MRIRIRFLLMCAALWLATVLGGKAQVLMHGYVGYDVFRSDVVIYVENITNFGDATTDRLRLRLWASEHDWSEEHPGRVLAVARIQKLKPGRDHDHVDRDVHFSRPHSGWYHIALTLEERVVAGDGPSIGNFEMWLNSQARIIFENTFSIPSGRSIDKR